MKKIYYLVDLNGNNLEASFEESYFSKYGIDKIDINQTYQIGSANLKFKIVEI